jgi:hypothetical protein
LNTKFGKIRRSNITLSVSEKSVHVKTDIAQKAERPDKRSGRKHAALPRFTPKRNPRVAGRGFYVFSKH